MNINMPPVAQDFDFWIELLVDGELSEEQQRELFSFMDEREGFWKSCAIAFVKEKRLSLAFEQLNGEDATSSQAELSSDYTLDGNHSLPASKTETQLRKTNQELSRGIGGHWVRIAGTVIAASLLIVTGWFAGRTGLVNGPNSLTEEGQPSPALYPVSVDAGAVYQLLDRKRQLEMESERANMQIERSRLANNPYLIEVENTPEKALYYSKHRLPDFLLDALVVAGHKVTIKKETVFASSEDLAGVQLPFHAFEIKKFGLIN